MADEVPSPSELRRASLEPTPLLFDHPNPNGQDNSLSVVPSTEGRPQASRGILILTLLSLCCSIITITFVITINLINAYPSPGYPRSWRMEYVQTAILILVCSIPCQWTDTCREHPNIYIGHTPSLSPFYPYFTVSG